MRRFPPSCRRLRLAAWVCILPVVTAPPAVAQSVDRATTEQESLVTPAASAASRTGSSVLTRDTDGHLILRATRIAVPIAVDGRLDEAAYRNVPAASGFVQQVPIEGAPVTERTEAWVLFDDTNLYIACRCSDANPERIVANDMRRDSSNISGQDGFTVALDTFNDERDGFMFTVAASGAMRDGTTSEERANFNWNTVWDAKASRSDRGWVTEMAIPFKSLRYRPGREQTWGIQMRRAIISKNETAYLTPVSPAWGRQAIHHFTEDAMLVGLEAPATRNLEMKPYAISTVTTDRLSSPPAAERLRPGWRHRCEVRVNEKPDRRLHLQHRFRAG